MPHPAIHCRHTEERGGIHFHKVTETAITSEKAAAGSDKAGNPKEKRMLEDLKAQEVVIEYWSNYLGKGEQAFIDKEGEGEDLCTFR